jgi:hypothetical protein|tara:strand:- start:188 stop:307 length:120 start_codon:yes stop_codon:yes gene_type:complete
MKSFIPQERNEEVKRKNQNERKNCIEKKGGPGLKQDLRS